MDGLKALMANPLVAVSGYVFGLLLSGFFYYASIERPDITFSVHPIRTAVVRADAASALTVLHRGKALSTDVSALQFAVWNAGKRPVRPTDILEPIFVELGTGAPILEARILKVSRPLADVRLDQSRLAEGSVGLSWSILEDGDGAVIQITYAGDLGVPVRVRGAVVGQRRPTEIEEKSLRSQEETYQRTRRDDFLKAFLSILLAAVLLFGFVKDRKLKRAHGGEWKRLLMFDVLVVAAASGFAGWNVWVLFRTSGPPFGF